MKCPKCNENEGFELYETSDDYQDGIVVCLNCGEDIATFNYSVIIKIEHLTNHDQTPNDS